MRDYSKVANNVVADNKVVINGFEIGVVTDEVADEIVALVKGEIKAAPVPAPSFEAPTEAKKTPEIVDFSAWLTSKGLANNGKSYKDTPIEWSIIKRTGTDGKVYYCVDNDLRKKSVPYSMSKGLLLKALENKKVTKFSWAIDGKTYTDRGWTTKKSAEDFLKNAGLPKLLLSNEIISYVNNGYSF